MPVNRGILLRALAKKKKFQNKDTKTNNNNNDSDSDGSISDDDVEELESNYLGQIVNDEYILVKYIGRGTFSRVWLVYDFILSKYFIFKIYLENDSEEYILELKTLQELKTKTNCKYNINYHGFLEHKFLNQSSICKILILPYLGLELTDLLSEKGDLSLRECKYIIKQILYGLVELHQQSILHTDLKMDNILSNYYSDENEEFTDWFSSLNISNHYKSILNFHTPDEEVMKEYDKSKRKKIKKKAKKKTITDLSSFIKKQLSNYDIKIIGLSEIDFNNNPNNNYNNDKQEIISNLSKKTLDENENENDNITIDTITQNIDIESIDLKTHNNIDNNELDNKKIINICDLKFTLTDYSNAAHIDDIDFDSCYQIRGYRSPEDIIGFEYSYKSELWAVGCILWDLLTNKYIFEPPLQGNSISRDRKQLALMEKYLGRMSKDLSLECERSYELFEQSGRIKKNRKVEKELLENSLILSRSDLTEKEINDTCQFLRKIWNYDTKIRPNINQILNDDFFKLD